MGSMLIPYPPYPYRSVGLEPSSAIPRGRRMLIGIFVPSLATASSRTTSTPEKSAFEVTRRAVGRGSPEPVQRKNASGSV